MITRILAVAILGSVVLAVSMAAEPASEPGPKVDVKWEYAEVSMGATRSGRGAKGDPDTNPKGGPGTGKGFGEITRTTSMIKWCMGEDEIEAKSWEDLATKLKLAPPKKKELSANQHRLRVLNHLGNQGWELISGPGGLSSSSSTFSTGAITYTFKRKIVK